MNKVAPINLYEAKTQLSALVERAAAGEEIVIAKNGKPMARLVPLAPAQKVKRRLTLAPWAKKLTPEQRAQLAEEVLKPWPAEEIELWYGSRLFPPEDERGGA
jgi:prevent-host-death family protein